MQKRVGKRDAEEGGTEEGYRRKVWKRGTE